jgi:hypothetical protein
MWMVLHVDEAVYTEYDQLRHVHVSVIDVQKRRLVRKREILALAAEGLVPGIPTTRSWPIPVEFLSQVCRDHAPAVHARYLEGRPGVFPLTGEAADVEHDGLLAQVVFRMAEPRSERVFA